MTTEIIAALAVFAALVLVVVVLKVRASKKVDIVDDFAIAPEAASEHTLTVDEATAQTAEPGIVSAPIVTVVSESAELVVPAAEPATVEVPETPTAEPVNETTNTETLEDACNKLDDAIDEAKSSVASLSEKTESLVDMLNEAKEVAKTAKTLADMAKPKKAATKSTKATTKKTTKKTTKATKTKDVANFIDTLSKPAEKKPRGRKKKSDDVKIIVTAPLGKSKTVKKKKA